MKLKKLITILFLTIGMAVAWGQDPALKTRYNSPATNWESEALPIGNGKIGGMVFGSVEADIILVNEKTLWSGGPGKNPNYDGGHLRTAAENHQTLQKVRSTLQEKMTVFTARQTARMDKNGKVTAHDYAPEDAELKANILQMTGNREDFGSYQQLSNIHIDFHSSAASGYTHYSRELDIDNAVAKTTYQQNGVYYTREYFISHPDNVIVIRLTTDKKGSLSHSFYFTSPQQNIRTSTTENIITLEGKPADQGDHGLKFAQQMMIIPISGTIHNNDTAITVENADEIVVISSAATNYHQSMDSDFNYFSDVNPVTIVKDLLKKVSRKTYTQLLETHLKDYKSLYGRMSVSLANAANTRNKTTDQLLKGYKDNTNTSEENLYLEQLYYQFGRYLLISSSRKGSLPANLQGIWAAGLNPPWNADYHTNINVQMNYWLAQQTNLSDCHLPVIEYTKSLVPRGIFTARHYYCKQDGSPVRGWVIHHENNIWGNTAPGNWYTAFYFPAAAAWMCQDIWEYYQFNQDIQFLADYYPMMVDAALFWVDNLWRDSRDGTLAANPSYSPEHGPYSLGASADQAIIWELFDMVVKASDVLGRTTPEVQEIKMAKGQLSGPRIGLAGQLMEWKDELAMDISGDNKHRHVNHLHWLHPGSRIVAGRSMRENLYAEAMKTTLNTRGDGGTGWSKAWKINFWARLHEGNRSHKLVQEILKESTLKNLFDTHPPFQIDGNFGATSGMTEMLVQSHGGYIEILPSLPDTWSSGSFKGIKARGNFEIDAEWHNGVITSLKVTSGSGNDCVIKYNGKRFSFPTVAGTSYDLSSSVTAMANDKMDENGLRGKRILYVYGGWEGHQPKECRDLFVPWLQSEGAEVFVSDQLSCYEDSALMADIDLIIQHYTMGNISGSQEKALCNAVKRGVGLAGWHGGTGDSFRNNPEFQYMVGGQWVSHPGGIISYRVTITDKEDPVTGGLNDFEMKSEQYYMHIDPHIKVLATTRFSGDHDSWIEGAVVPVVWKKQYGKGRVFYSSLGHTTSDFDVPEAFEIMQRGIRWAAQSLHHSQADKGIKDAITTVYPTKDLVISDFIVTDPRFGAKAEPGFDNRIAFQAAIDAAYNHGGGVVYIPAGNYEFHSTRTGSQHVRVREGDTETNKTFNYEYVLQLPQSVQLRGDWADPELHDGKVLGTILEVYAGKESPNHNGSVESWWNDPQANNALHTTYTSIADRFIDMREGTGVTNLSIWYPEQEIKDIKPYPWTLYQATGNSATVENVTLVNAYNGFYSAPSELHYLLHNYVTALNTGVEVHVCTDIGRIENVKVNPKYWANSGLPGSPSLKEVTAYTKADGTGFKMHRSDWEYVSYLDISGYKTGMWIGREPGFNDAPNAQFYGVHIDNCEVGLYVQDVNPYGLLFSNSTFGTDEKGVAVYFYNYFSSSVQFNGVDFHGPIVSEGRDGVISFENCTFDHYKEYALSINNGKVLLTQSEFKQPDRHVYLNENVNALKSINAGYNRLLKVVDNSRNAQIDIEVDDKSLFEAIPKNIKTELAVHPKPESEKVMRVDLPRATGFDNNTPTTDISDELQAALHSVKAAGGGTVYLPGGRYLVDKPVTIPSGVELRGTWDVQHHTQSGGTAIFTNYTGGSAGEEGPSLIQLEANAGIRGFKIAQLNIATEEFSISNPRKTPFLIQGQGKDVYIVNITVSAGDKGIDLASYQTDRHYVDYFAGILSRAGIWVGGGAEGGFIRNIQLNPHYGMRHPREGQGYPNINMTHFIQAHCSGLKFADVKNQTIFNNFVYGSVYGIHFLKDAITGNDPGEMTIIGHGSDGCTYALFVENADEHTRIVAINSELVNTHIQAQPVRSYLLMGDEVNTGKVHPDAQLILYNSAFWGSPTVGAIINNGTIRFQQANFQRTGTPCIDVRGGKAHIYSSYFAQKMTEENTGNSVYGRLHATGTSIELSNNYYQSGLITNSAKPKAIFGTDIGEMIY